MSDFQNILKDTKTRVTEFVVAHKNLLESQQTLGSFLDEANALKSEVDSILSNSETLIAAVSTEARPPVVETIVDALEPSKTAASDELEVVAEDVEIEVPVEKPVKPKVEKAAKAKPAETSKKEVKEDKTPEPVETAKVSVKGNKDTIDADFDDVFNETFNDDFDSIELEDDGSDIDNIEL